MVHPAEILGKRVVAAGPNASWEGQAIAYTDSPTYLIETDSGHRLMLPAEWVTPADPKGQNDE